jgi:predicted nucleic acid-binding protein
MIVYVESNFVFELALMREEHSYCKSLLDFAAAQKIILAIPAYSIGEPYETLIRRSKHRKDLHDKLEVELNELSRSQPYEKASQELKESAAFLLKSNEEEERRLGEALNDILEVAKIIPLDAQTVRNAFPLQQSHDLSPQDSIVFASILAHLTGASPQTSCFITKNSRDFVVTPVLADLAKYNCKLLTRFSDGLGFINSHAPLPSG